MNHKYPDLTIAYSAIGGMVGILISFIIAFVVCYVTYHRERQVEKLQLEEKAMRDFVLRE